MTGTWEKWRTPGVPLRKYADNFHMVELELRPGVHQYKYIIDGRWLHSETQPVVKIGRCVVSRFALSHCPLAPRALPPQAPARRWRWWRLVVRRRRVTRRRNNINNVVLVKDHIGGGARLPAPTATSALPSTEDASDSSELDSFTTSSYA